MATLRGEEKLTVHGHVAPCSAKKHYIMHHNEGDKDGSMRTYSFELYFRDALGSDSLSVGEFTSRLDSLRDKHNPLLVNELLDHMLYDALTSVSPIDEVRFTESANVSA